MNISKIDPSLTLEKICFSTESHFLDRKSARLAPKDLGCHLSAFANASGGVVIIGIENDGTITGVSENQENDFRKVAFDFLQIPPEYKVEKIHCSTHLGEEKNVLLFHIYPAPNEIIKLKSGEAYLRAGDSSRKLTSEQLTALEYSKGIRSYESRIISEATYDDLDQELLQKYVSILNPSASSVVDILKSRGLIKEYEDGYKITVAAILLFGKCPTQFLPGSRVRFLRYEGVTAEVGSNFNLIKDVTIEKPLHMLLSFGQNLLEAQMREFQQLGKDGVFKKIPEYPAFAWLEGMVNAVVHRDYSIQGDYIRITMFDDRIEFSSPGKLPSIVTVNNIQTTRFSRNPIIARVLGDFGWVRELNEGVKRIYADMESFFLDPPIFSEPNGNTVSLVLHNNIATRSIRRATSQKVILDNWNFLSDFDKSIVFYIANADKCTPKQLTDFTKKSRPTILSHIKSLVAMDIIEEHSVSLRDPTKYYTIKLIQNVNDDNSKIL